MEETLHYRQVHSDNKNFCQLSIFYILSFSMISKIYEAYIKLNLLQEIYEYFSELENQRTK